MDSDWCDHPTDRQHSCINENYYNYSPKGKYEDTDKKYVKPRKVRCPSCNKYLTPKVVSTGCPCCGPYLVIPRHKKKFHDRPSNKKARKKKEGRGYNVRGK